MDGDTAKKITIDVATNVSPEDSQLLYGAEELAFYRKVEAEFAAIKAKNPNAILDIRE